MAWRIKNDTLQETNGDIICIFPVDLDPFYSKLIKKSNDILGMFFEFKETYEVHKKMSKKLFDRFANIIEDNRDYDFRWRFTKDGDIVDHTDKKICSFSDKEHPDAFLIQYVPEILFEVKKYFATFTSKDAKQKPLYEIFQKIFQKMNED